MRINKKFLILTSIVFFTLAATAYASSSQFLTQAQKYINANCSKKQIDNQTALLCYLFNKAQEQNSSISSLNTSLSPIPSEINSLKNHQSQTDQFISSLQTNQASQASQINGLQNTSGKSFKVFDANNQELGILIDGAQQGGTPTIYNETSGKIISIDGNGGISPWIGANYTSTDCSGTAYLSPLNFNDYFFSIGRGQYAIEDPTAIPTSQLIHSYYNPTTASGGPNCNTFSQARSEDSQTLILVPYPYPNQIVLPLILKYQ